MIAAAQQQFPQHRFELSFGPDAHNGKVRFAWQLYGPDGGEPVAGPEALGVRWATLAELETLATTPGLAGTVREAFARVTLRPESLA